MPQWEHKDAKCDTDYTDSKKSENTNILVIEAREHIKNTYPNHIQIFTDGSVLDSLDSGAGFYICNIPLAIFNIVICVDSKSVLYALQNWDCKMRRDIVYEVKYMIHYIISRGIGVEFCWVSSHCGLYWNEISDKLAKQGAMKNRESE